MRLRVISVLAAVPHGLEPMRKQIPVRSSVTSSPVNVASLALTVGLGRPSALTPSR